MLLEKNVSTGVVAGAEKVCERDAYWGPVAEVKPMRTLSTPECLVVESCTPPGVVGCKKDGATSSIVHPVKPDSKPPFVMPSEESAPAGPHGCRLR
jgi:hypothetical protein